HGYLTLKTDYATKDQVHRWLSACNVLVFNYITMAHSSASAAIRTGMATGRPIICTHSAMFEEFNHREHVLKVPFGDQAALSAAIVELYTDPELGKTLVANCDAYLQKSTPTVVAENHLALYESLLQTN